MSHSDEFLVERIKYGSDEHQFGDLRLPAGDGPFPVVVVIHGGFWYAQYGLDLMDAISADLTARGFATWNIEYRRVGHPGGGWPGTLQDVGEAMDELRSIAQSHPLALDEVYTMGHSAGGHLALWLAARQRLVASSPLHRDRPLLPKGAISLAGVADLAHMWEVRQVESPVVDFIGGRPDTYPERYRDASPAQLLPLSIRQTLIHGQDDRHVPLCISQNYYDLAMEHGDEITLHELPGVEHFQVIDPTTAAWQTILLALEDLRA